jgi:hypothetical protein
MILEANHYMLARQTYKIEKEDPLDFSCAKGFFSTSMK